MLFHVVLVSKLPITQHNVNFSDPAGFLPLETSFCNSYTTCYFTVCKYPKNLHYIQLHCFLLFLHVKTEVTKKHSQIVDVPVNQQIWLHYTIVADIVLDSNPKHLHSAFQLFGLSINCIIIISLYCTEHIVELYQIIKSALWVLAIEHIGCFYSCFS